MSLVEKIKALFESETVKSNFTDAKLEDGTVIRIEGDLKEGAKVSVIAEDGSITPAPAGDHKLDDGTVITIDDKGTVTAVVAPQANAEMADAPAPTETEAPAEQKAEDDKSTALEAKVAELEAAINAIAEQVKALMDGGQMQAELSEVKKENKTLKKAVKELSAEPATPAASFKKTEISDKTKTNNTNAKLSMLERVIALREKNN